MNIFFSKLFILQQPERQMVTIRSSGSGLPILPRGASVVSSSSSMGTNVLKIALPSTSANRPQKAQRIILPSEAIRVIDTSGATRISPQIQPKKVCTYVPIRFKKYVELTIVFSDLGYINATNSPQN